MVAILVFSSELFGLLHMASDLQSGHLKTSKLPYDSRMKNRNIEGLQFQVFKKIRNESFCLLILVKFLMVKLKF